VQPVWRADRPQKGRYREFYQCDADVVGSASLLNEAEFIMIYDEALSLLGLKDFSIKINNRKILSGIAQVIDKNDSIIDMTVAIDKLDKIGFDGVVKELLERGLPRQISII
jgi:histidyl-tRNA synthetase